MVHLKYAYDSERPRSVCMLEVEKQILVIVDGNPETSERILAEVGVRSRLVWRTLYYQLFIYVAYPADTLIHSVYQAKMIFCQ